MPERIVAIGERDQVRAFRAVGVEVVPVANLDEAIQALRQHAVDDPATLVLLSEPLAQEMAEQLQEIRSRSRAMLLVIPSHRGTAHASLREMKALIERSIGVDMIGKIESE